MVALAFTLLPQSAFATNQTPAVLVAIANCESGDGTPESARQFNADGSVVSSYTHDYGYFQINRIHLKEAKKLGYDIMTEEGNISFALYLYQHQGTKPWSASKYCWGSQAPPSQRLATYL